MRRFLPLVCVPLLSSGSCGMADQAKGSIQPPNLIAYFLTSPRGMIPGVEEYERVQRKNALVVLNGTDQYDWVWGRPALHITPAGQEITLWVRDGEGREFTGESAMGTASILCYGPYYIHAVISLCPKDAVGRALGVTVDWHLIANKGEPSIRTWVEMRHREQSPDLTLTAVGFRVNKPGHHPQQEEDSLLNQEHHLNSSVPLWRSPVATFAAGRSGIQQALGKKQNSGLRWEPYTGHWMGRLPRSGEIEFHFPSEKGGILRVRLANRYLPRNPVIVEEKTADGWRRTDLIPWYEFGLNRDEVLLWVPDKRRVRIKEAAHGVRIGHARDTGLDFQLQVANDADLHCWHFDSRAQMTQGGAGRLLGGAESAFAPPGRFGLCWWAGAVYGMEDAFINPFEKVQLIAIRDNGPERVRFSMRSYSGDGTFQWDGNFDIPWRRDMNLITLDLTCTALRPARVGAEFYSFRFPIGTEPYTTLFKHLSYLRGDGAVQTQDISHNNRVWTPAEPLAVPGWYALYDSQKGTGNIGVVIRSADYPLLICCLDEPPDAKDGYFDEVFLVDSTVPGKNINNGRLWHLAYDLFIYSDKGFSPVQARFQRFLAKQSHGRKGD